MGLDQSFSFIDSNGPLHSLHPLIKLCCLGLLSFIAFAGGWGSACFLGLVVVAGLLTLPRPWDIVRSSLGYLAYMGFAVFFFSVLRLDIKRPIALARLPGSAAYLSRLCLVYFLSEIFFKSTRPRDLGDALSALRAALGLGRSGRLDPGFLLANAVETLPRLFSSYKAIYEAALVRGYGRNLRSAPQGAKIILAFLQRAISASLSQAWSLEARCYGPGRSLRAFRLGLGDLACLGLCGLGLLAARLLP